MNQEKTTEEQMLQMLTTCYEKAWTSDDFFKSLSRNGVETYTLNEQVEGIVIDGKNVSLDSLGYPHEAIQSLDAITLTGDDIAMIDRYYAEMQPDERHLKASDIVPGFKQWEEELGTARAGREDELDVIREAKEADKGIDKGVDR